MRTALLCAAACALAGGAPACSRTADQGAAALAPPELHNDPQALAYRGRAPVPDADARQLLAQTVSAARSRPVWAESAHVHAADGPIGDGKPKFLFGEARLFLVEYETAPGKYHEVDARDDATMAWADARFFFDLLSRWSREHGISWDVQLGALRGGIGANGPDAGAQRILEALRAQSGADPQALDAVRAQLDAKYRDRRE